MATWNFKRVNGPTSFAVQLEDGRLLRRHQHHLLQRSCVPQASTADQEVPADPIPASPAAEQPELQLEEPQRSRLFWCNHLPKAFQRSVTLLGTDTPLDTWLILLLSDFLGY